MKNEYTEKQEKNREDALEHISKWLVSCIIDD